MWIYVGSANTRRILWIFNSFGKNKQGTSSLDSARWIQQYSCQRMYFSYDRKLSGHTYVGGQTADERRIISGHWMKDSKTLPQLITTSKGAVPAQEQITINHGVQKDHAAIWTLKTTVFTRATSVAGLPNRWLRANNPGGTGSTDMERQLDSYISQCYVIALKMKGWRFYRTTVLIFGMLRTTSRYCWGCIPRLQLLSTPANSYLQKRRTLPLLYM
ncbi:unnamed protein product [Nesidiocoris tenuis]|uniref:Uncharacterized protein n=1 Tax=Nesidiocoris tenuis TaxID=355587 RepID=A0A6H5G7M2_9HEMI|nr:unnamed protein product [Nesidiocoris tenuis]